MTANLQTVSAAELTAWAQAANPYDTQCPNSLCLAEPTQKCRTESGAPRDTPHIIRTDAAVTDRVERFTAVRGTAELRKLIGLA